MFDQHYPHLASWILGGGWIELGQDDYSRSLVRILDIGGLICGSGARPGAPPGDEFARLHHSAP